MMTMTSSLFLISLTKFVLTLLPRQLRNQKNAVDVENQEDQGKNKEADRKIVCSR
jgi:hypothetical protein